MSNRTDLAIEYEKIDNESVFYTENIGDFEVVFHELSDNNSFSKKKGKYATLKVGKIDLLPNFDDLEKAIVKTLKIMLPKDQNNVLIVGLGNNEIISDSIGPFTSSKILATRHIKTDFAEKIGLKNLKSVAVLTPNVLGKTGIEAAETVLAVVNKIKPDLVIVIDALCASGCENLFSVIQFSNSGISPGSGVKNARKELSFYTLGVPTLAIGVPTVVEAKSIVKNYVNFDDFNIDLLLTPKDTDLLCHKMSDVLARSLNVFLQPMIDKETLISLV